MARNGLLAAACAGALLAAGPSASLVADDRDTITFGFHLPDELDFVLGQAVTNRFFASDFASDTRRYKLAISGNHGDAPHADCF